MAAILTLTQQQEIKPISPNWAAAGKTSTGVTNYDQLEQEIEEDKLRKLLGNGLLQDLQDNPTDANNVILLDGGTFEDSQGTDIKFKGIRYVTAYLVFVDYVAESDVSDTFGGMVTKNRQESTALTSGKTKTLQSKFKDIALTQWELVEAYLNKNKDLFPLWKCAGTTRPYRTPRITGIKRTIY
jgi:hypothetical protein